MCTKFCVHVPFLCLCLTHLLQNFCFDVLAVRQCDYLLFTFCPNEVNGPIIFQQHMHRAKCFISTSIKLALLALTKKKSALQRYAHYTENHILVCLKFSFISHGVYYKLLPTNYNVVVHKKKHTQLPVCKFISRVTHKRYKICFQREQSNFVG